MSLENKKCVPCEVGTPPLTAEESKRLIHQVPGWKLDESGKLSRSYRFKTFMDAVTFMNTAAGIAEREGHHPDMCLTDYSKLKIMLWTHASKGLTENDFILAAKISGAYEQREMAAIINR